jgi:hypothetical protein
VLVRKKLIAYRGEIGFHVSLARSKGTKTTHIPGMPKKILSSGYNNELLRTRNAMI